MGGNKRKVGARGWGQEEGGEGEMRREGGEGREGKGRRGFYNRQTVKIVESIADFRLPGFVVDGTLFESATRCSNDGPLNTGTLSAVIRP